MQADLVLEHFPVLLVAEAAFFFTNRKAVVTLHCQMMVSVF